MRFILFLSLPLYALDQWSKQLVVRLINPYQSRVVVPDLFNLVNVHQHRRGLWIFQGQQYFFHCDFHRRVGGCDGSPRAKAPARCMARPLACTVACWDFG